MSSRSPGVMSSTPGMKNFIAFCALIAPTTTSSTSTFNVRRRIQQFGVQFFADQVHGWIAKDLLIRQHAEQFQALALEAAPREVGDVIHFFAQHLVENDADDLDALLFKQRLVERDFINRFADAALRDDDDLGAENFCDLGVGQIKNRADAGVPAAFAQHKILFPGDAVEGLLDFFDQRLVVRRIADICG